jgi:cellulose synthase (UDP-forming)
MRAERSALPTFVNSYLRPLDAQDRAALRLGLLRVLIVTNLLFGFFYLSWRYNASINWAAWPLALALLAAETYSYIDAWLFGMTMWRIRERPAPPPPNPSATVDVFITCYNEPVDLVRQSTIAARAIRWPHQTYILDDGSSPEMRAMAAAEGVGYIVRSTDWQGKNRHAKAGNLNNALFQTQGEFLLILDADQLAAPEILDHTLGHFHDPQVSFVQTPQPFYNVPDGDPFGSHAPLFYGPIQQGKDGWNAAYFCGSNAVLRREALMHIGITQYVRELEQRVRRALRTADRMLGQAERRLTPLEDAHTRAALRELRAATQHARASLRQGAPIQELTWEFQRRAHAVARLLVSRDLLSIQAELADIPGLDVADLEASLANVIEDDAALGALASRATSPLTAIETVRALLLAVDLDREDEAQPVMPMSTISVTEDMATAMRLHGTGWKSIYHHENLARGLAPEDLRTALQQRLRWAQGTIQVLLRESPLSAPGLAFGQRLMYFTTMWSYLSGFFSVIYLMAPVLTLLFGVLPLRARTSEFFWHILPYLVINQILSAVIGWRKSTWRGQQYSLALFPLWITAVLTAIGNVYFGRKLGFVVTPKTRQGIVPLMEQLRLVWPQLLAMVLLVAAILFGLGRLALGWTEDGVPILVNVLWGCYDLIMLSAVIDAALYRPVDNDSP